MAHIAPSKGRAEFAALPEGGNGCKDAPTSCPKSRTVGDDAGTIARSLLWHSWGGKEPHWNPEPVKVVPQAPEWQPLL